MVTDLYVIRLQPLFSAGLLSPVFPFSIVFLTGTRIGLYSMLSIVPVVLFCLGVVFVLLNKESLIEFCILSSSRTAVKVSDKSMRPQMVQKQTIQL
jgi:hypothetical protein